MRLKITCIALLTSLLAHAQTISFANFFPSVSTTLNAIMVEPSSFGMSLTTTTGTGVTWNAAGLTQQSGTPTLHLSYTAPVFSPHGSLFPASNYVQVDPALTAFVSYEYVNYGPDSVVLIGRYDPSSAHEIYQNPDKFLVFPFDYGQTFSDDYSKTNYSDSITMSSIQTGTRNVSFNGYGTLILPQGSFTNVALVSEVRTNSLGPDSHKYTWYDINNGKRLMMYEENAGTTTIAYNSDAATTVEAINSELSAKLFPNPMTNTAILKCNIENVNDNTILILYNVMGMKLRTIAIKSNEVLIQRENLEEGTYFYVLQNGSMKIDCGKLQVVD